MNVGAQQHKVPEHQEHEPHSFQQPKTGAVASQHVRPSSQARLAVSKDGCLPLCALLAGIGHTVKITMFALEKSKSRKVHMPGDFGSKSRKIRKNRKVEKSKSSKNSKNSKSRKLFGFLTFCENFPWKSDKPRGFWRHWSTGSIHAQGFLWLFGCSFPVEWLVTFQGSRKLAISVSGLDFVLLM